MAIIKVGGATETEVKERKDRVDDALHATRAAVEEGIVPGGGVALLRAIKALDGLQADNDDQKIGINIVRKALQAPARQIVQNAGDDGSVVVGKILENSKYNFGYNAQTGTYGDLVADGVIDPAKVVRCALQDAASIAGLLITTEAMVAERPKEAGPAMPRAAAAWVEWAAWVGWTSKVQPHTAIARGPGVRAGAVSIPTALPLRPNGASGRPCAGRDWRRTPAPRDTGPEPSSRTPRRSRRRTRRR